MNTISNIKRVTLPLVSALCLGAGSAQATSWGDYQAGNTVVINSLSSSSTTVISQVTVTCPTAGHLIARATGNFVTASSSGSAYIGVSAGISVDDPPPVAFESASTHHFKAPLPYMNVPMSLQRTSYCAAGVTRTFRFVGMRWQSDTLSSVANPILTVEFFDQQI